MRYLLSLLCLAVIPRPALGQRVDLSPERWPLAERQLFDSLTRQWSRPIPLARGTSGIIAGTSAASAVRAGLEALKQGGSAIDAALTHAMAEIVLLAGCCVSHAGFMTLVYYEAATGKVHSMNAGWNTVLAETDPLTIPNDKPSGRTAMVPGFMAGAEAAHRRFGKLPWAALFAPAIHYAEQGMVLDPAIGGMIGAKKTVLERLPASKAVFTRQDGGWYQAGDLFKQPALAGTLRNVAKRGASYMYRGEWARKLVAAVRADGGRMTMEDLARYQPIWAEPARGTFRDYEVFAIAPPTTGGVNLLEALNLVELADLRGTGHYTTSADAAERLLRISRMSDLMGSSILAMLFDRPRALIERYAGPVDFSVASRLSKPQARSVWDRMQTADWTRLDREAFEQQGRIGSDHSDAVVVADAQGNVAALLHTINTSTWGSTGIIVDGVSIADPARYQQRIVARAGPGNRHPDPTNPLIVLRNGKPILASSSIGTGLHEQTLQSIVNVLEYGMDPKSAVDTAQFLRPLGPTQPPRAPGDTTRADPASQVVADGEFTPALLGALRAKGRTFTVVPGRQGSSWRGGWVGIVLDPATGQWLGAGPRFFNGWALGY
jgi:gamma-glutamyltranspeptidase/glutathione hydrolase